MLRQFNYNSITISKINKNIFIITIKKTKTIKIIKTKIKIAKIRKIIRRKIQKRS